MPAGRPKKHRIESSIDEMTWAVLVRAGFEFGPRTREFLEGQARLHLAALGVTDFAQKTTKDGSWRIPK